MNEDRVEGTLKSGMGQAQRGLGNLTGDSQMQAEGTRQEMMGRAQHLYGTARDQVRSAANQMSQSVSEHPVRSLLIAGAVGCAAALLTGRRRRRDRAERELY
ncbi:CsbD family protein [Pedomonas sp. V897]|uniref:CsbD family protein n=1 Tax=Pedomonas sp. V897 TaxID=3446482 RepID=UPI003EE23A14